ncbi:MAG: glycoside hydrolase family 16 protein [Planctomycetes bacterium]|nr:glycoside hydrolase family 16 protein [Planctomycetota bacterium]
MNRLIVLLVLSTQALGAVIWQDTFDGPSIDTSLWAFEVGNGTDGWGNWERQYYTNNGNNAYIESGNLVIEAKNEYQSGYWFTSARMKTQGKLTFKYGTLKARIKIPDLADGLWPAFWLLGANIDQVGVGWPKCGELDIMEMGHSSAIAAGTQNRQVGAHAFWDNAGSNADYGGSTIKSVDLNDDYHIYKVTWTPYLITTYIDDVSFWSIDITPANLEEFHEHMFILLNMAVGGTYTGIYDDNDITAPMPAKMYIDYVQIEENAWTELWDGSLIDNSERGYFGVFTDTTPIKDAITFGTDADFYVWNNLTSTSTAPYEGSNVWSFNANPGSWFGAGAYCTVPRDMQHYTNGELRFHMKTTSTNNIGIGIRSTDSVERWITLVNGGQQYGLTRDGNWHEVTIPLSLYSDVDFTSIDYIFMFNNGNQTPSSTVNVSFDNIYWVPTPGDGDFDGDGDANMIDFSTLAGFWLETNCWSLNDCDNADADGDGNADFDDLAVLMSDWLIL